MIDVVKTLNQLFFLSPEDVNKHVNIEESVFGICYRKIYRGTVVAVEQFKDSVSNTSFWPIWNTQVIAAILLFR